MKVKYSLSLAVFIAGLCSIVYELLISATASYFIGDSITQFSILIGIYLFSMGIGAYLSKYFKNKPIHYFIYTELLLGIIGGLSIPILYFIFVTFPISVLQWSCYTVMLMIGLLTGMEVPLLTFAFDSNNYKNFLSNILSLDYIGGLIATLLFPFVLLPFLGLFESSLIFGIINIALGIWVCFCISKKLNFISLAGLISILFLAILLSFSNHLLKNWEEKIYKNPIILNKQSPYQKIVLTENNEKDVKLFLNRQLQFSSKDEYRYHEMLVHIPLLWVPKAEKVLVLGGGENLATRELLKYPNIKQIDVVDIDNAMFDVSKKNAEIVNINNKAAFNPKVHLIAEDAFLYLKNTKESYDLIIADLPDPSNDILARLYSKQFYLLVKKNLKKEGVFVTQSCDVYFTNKTFNCIVNTLGNVFQSTKPYQTFVPSFGNWGFTLAADYPLEMPEKIELPENLSYLDTNLAQSSFHFPKDIPLRDTKINTLDNPLIINYFLEEWKQWKENANSE